MAFFVTSSGIRKCETLLPRTKHSFKFQNRSPSGEVQTTSFRKRFQNPSQEINVPEYDSPFLVSTKMGRFFAVLTKLRGRTIVSLGSPQSAGTSNMWHVSPNQGAA